jgi:hypothetical protein
LRNWNGADNVDRSKRIFFFGLGARWLVRIVLLVDMNPLGCGAHESASHRVVAGLRGRDNCDERKSVLGSECFNDLVVHVHDLADLTKSAVQPLMDITREAWS